MSQPVVEKIIRGEELSLEIRLIGENLTGATAFVTADPGIDTTETIVNITDLETITVSDQSTAHWQVGTHRLRVWVEFPDRLPEMVLEVRVAVEPEIEFDPLTTFLIIDGGQPGTVYDEPSSPFDGGEG